jgi:hypothetical protein
MNETARRKVIIGSGSYGLYFGEIEASDEEIIAKKAVRLFGCRHIRRWYGGTGGITSLAAWGPKANKDNRIGAPATSALITNVVNVYDVTPEAAAAFESVLAQR